MCKMNRITSKPMIIEKPRNENQLPVMSKLVKYETRKMFNSACSARAVIRIKKVTIAFSMLVEFISQ